MSPSAGSLHPASGATSGATADAVAVQLGEFTTPAAAASTPISPSQSLDQTLSPRALLADSAHISLPSPSGVHADANVDGDDSAHLDLEAGGNANTEEADEDDLLRHGEPTRDSDRPVSASEPLIRHAAEDPASQRQAALAPALEAAPASVGLLFKLACLCVLLLQNTAATLVSRYSRGVLHEKYVTTTAVLLCEILKLGVAVAMVVYVSPLGLRRSVQQLPSYLLSLVWSRGMAVMGVPGLFYFAHNQLVFLSLQHIDAATFSVIVQLKFVTAAVFARALLGRKLYWYQHRALWLLVIGVVLVQGFPGAKDPHTQAAPDPAAAADEAGDGSVLTPDSSAMSAAVAPGFSGDFIGVSACLVIAMISGFCGAYMEKALKSSTLDVWDRNVQLSVFGIFFSLVQLAFARTEAEVEFQQVHGFWGGYSGVAVTLVLINVCGGIVTALVLKHLDNIVRGFASGLSIVLTACLSYYLFQDIAINLQFIGGIAAVCISVANYADKPNQPPLA